MYIIAMISVGGYINLNGNEFYSAGNSQVEFQWRLGNLSTDAYVVTRKGNMVIQDRIY